VTPPPAYCCLTCRLLQDATKTCSECGSFTLISLDSGREALEYNDLTVATAPPNTIRGNLRTAAFGFTGLTAYAGLIVGCFLWPPAIPIAAGSALGATAAAVGWRVRKRGMVSKITRWPVKTDKVDIEKSGIARKLSETLPSIVDDAPMLAEQTEILLGGRGVLFRRVRNVPFFVELDGGSRVVVAGTLRLEVPVTSRKLRTGDAALPKLGIPADTKMRGRLETATIRDGDRITVIGGIAVEILQQLAFHRDAGEVNVARGHANGVVLLRAQV
jgi:hypothetical protein